MPKKTFSHSSNPTCEETKKIIPTSKPKRLAYSRGASGRRPTGVIAILISLPRMGVTTCTKLLTFCLESR